MKLIYTKTIPRQLQFSNCKYSCGPAAAMVDSYTMSASEDSRLKVLVNSCHIGHYLRPVGSLDLTHVIDVLIAAKMEIALIYYTYIIYYNPLILPVWY